MIERTVEAIEKQIEDLEVCDHYWEVRVKKSSSGQKMYCRQCARCGEKKDMWISHNKVENKDDIKPINDNTAIFYRQNIYELKQALFERKREIEKSDFDEWYHYYLQSPEWKSTRIKVLQRCGFICEGCGEKRATTVHHLTYKNVGREFLFELKGLCKGCHDRYHATEEHHE